jgi:malate dehydrogenase
MGEHGGSMVVMPRFTLVNGKPLSELVSPEKADELAKRAVNGGAEIVAFLKTGSAFYAPSASVAAMVEAIFLGSGKVMNCAAVLDGEYGLRNIVLGVPVQLGKGGIKEIITLPLDGQENARLQVSAEMVKAQIASLSL